VAKAQLRNERPLVLAISTNDGLAGNAVNIGKLLDKKNVYFVPFAQDNPQEKPRSLVCNMSLLADTIDNAIKGKQIQPILLR
jgi:dipicolinate synthase subunit B